MIKIWISFLLLIGVEGAWAQTIKTPVLELKTIFSEPFLPGLRPSIEGFSPDNSSIYFTWNDSSKSERFDYVAALKSKSIDRLEKETSSNRSLSPDGNYIAYVRSGDLFLSKVGSSKEITLTQTPGFEYGIEWSQDSKRIAYVSEGNVWVCRVDSPGIIQVTNKKDDQPGYSIATWAGNNDQLVLIQYDRSDYKEYYFPEYAGEEVKSGRTRRGIATITITKHAVDSTSVTNLVQQRGWVGSVESSADGKYIAIDLLSANMKKRDIHLFSTFADSGSIIFQDSTQGWINSGYIELQFAPDSQSLLFSSEQDGWNHIYQYTIGSKQLSQLTKGSYEVQWFEFINEKEFIYASNEVDYGVRHLYRYSFKKNISTQITKANHYRRDFTLSPNKRYLAYLKTTWNQPHEIFYLDLKKPQKEIQLTNTTPESFFSYDLKTPDYIRFTGRDGETGVSMTILPSQKTSESSPVIVFVHGAGSLQNVFQGWSNSYWREYLFHQYLSQQGYTVIEVDYRHSLGYGRKFREDVTNWMGKYETHDIIDGLAEAKKRYPSLDLDRVGIYGGSYGGFMALYAVGVAPTHFHAAAALRSVTNWRNYYRTNPWYTFPRLGDPETSPDHYDRSSPITYADSLQRPVLLLHGLIDNNVGFQDAVQYIERLIQSGNTRFDMMMYPTERHSFQDPDAWFDEYRRIYTFFKNELKGE